MKIRKLVKELKPGTRKAKRAVAIGCGPASKRARASSAKVSLSKLRSLARENGFDLDLNAPEKFADYWSAELRSDQRETAITVYDKDRTAVINAAYSALKEFL